MLPAVVPVEGEYPKGWKGFSAMKVEPDDPLSVVGVVVEPVVVSNVPLDGKSVRPSGPVIPVLVVVVPGSVVPA
ncbi:MAG TPA: hypothetical protein VF444_14860 [Pseudonocardiaceae bacterium]